MILRSEHSDALVPQSHSGIPGGTALDHRCLIYLVPVCAIAGMFGIPPLLALFVFGLSLGILVCTDNLCGSIG